MTANESAKRAAVFLDRDGTLVEEVGYAGRPEDIRLLPGATDAVAALRKAGFLAVLLTNQSGIARGYFGEEDLLAMHRKLEKDLAASGAALDGIYHCPHHPQGTVDRYAVACGCRKPAPGMLRQAISDLAIDPARSFVVGDSIRDLFPGFTPLGGRILVLTGHGSRSQEEFEARSIPVSRTAKTIKEAAERILARNQDL